MKSKEQLFDENTEAMRSDINFDTYGAGDLGLGGDYALLDLYKDFVFAEYIDMNKGFQTTKSGLVTVDTKTKSFRKAVVRMVGTTVAKYGRTKVGDIIMFPNDRGLVTGSVNYVDADGNVKTAEDGIFLNEERIISSLRPL